MRCDNNTLLKLINNVNLTQDTEVDFNLLENLPDCKKINANKYIAVNGTATFDQYLLPENRFECLRIGCINSGTLEVEGEGASATYFLGKDATAYANGIFTFYYKPADGATYPISLTVTLSADAQFTNADSYSISIPEANVTDDGFAPVIVDLRQTPTDIGNGWTPSVVGTYIRIASTGDLDGVSSLAMFDSMADFATNDTVKIRCLSGIEGSYDISALEATCTASGYDTSSTSGFDFTVTGRLMSANYNKLNPLEGRGTADTGFDINTVQKTIESYTVGDKTYGKVTLADRYQDECGFMAVQIADSCDVTGAGLVRLMLPNLVDVDGGHYQIIDNEDGTTDVIFNAQFIGKNVLISYPYEVDVEEMVGDMNNVGNVRVRMSYERKVSDGTKYRFVYNNVLVTSFPAGITNEDADVSFTLNVQKDNDGYFYHKYRILS